jgi:hypothetical protein
MLKSNPPSLAVQGTDISCKRRCVLPSFPSFLFRNFHLFTISRTARQFRESITTELCVLAGSSTSSPLSSRHELKRMFSQGQTYDKFREEMGVRWIQVWAAWWVVQDSEKLDPVVDNFINRISVSLVGWHSEVSLSATRHSNRHVRPLHLGQAHPSSEQCRCQYSSPRKYLSFTFGCQAVEHLL